MDKKITIWTTKGGCGKTSISAELALRLQYPVITNEKNSMLSHIIEKDRLLILQEEQDIPDLDTGVIFDFGGFIDNRLVKVLKLSDIVIVPTLPEASDIQGCIYSLSTIKNYNSNAIVVVNKTENKKDFISVKSIINDIDNLPIFEIKKSRAFPNIYIKKQSIKEMSNHSPLDKYNYRKVLEQLDYLIKSLKL